MKNITSLFLCLFLLSACDQFTQKEEATDSTKLTLVEEKPVVQQTLPPKEDSTKAIKAAVKEDRFALFLDDKSNYQLKTDQLFGKPISFYLNHKKVVPQAVELFNDPTKIGDNPASYEVLNQLISTKDEEIRPLYFHLCNYMARFGDGGLSEAIAPAMRTIVEEHPAKFADYVMRTDYAGRRQLFDDYVFHLKFEMRRNGDLNAAIDQLQKKFEEKCVSCDQDTKRLLDLVIAKLKEG